MERRTNDDRRTSGIATTMAITVGGIIFAAMSAFYIAQIETNKQIASAREDYMTEISNDRQRLSVVETDSQIYKEDISEVKGDIKELLKGLGIKEAKK